MLAKLSDNLSVLTPWRTVNDLERNFWDLLNDLHNSAVRRAGEFPSIVMEENDTSYSVQFALPGYTADDFEITVVGAFLTVKANGKSTPLDNGDRYLHRERPTGSYEETVKLPGRIIPGEVTARYTDGILTVELPRHEAEKPMTVKVTV